MDYQMLYNSMAKPFLQISFSCYILRRYRRNSDKLDLLREVPDVNIVSGREKELVVAFVTFIVGTTGKPVVNV